MMVAMDTKFGRIYCVISEVRFFYIFNSNSLTILRTVMNHIKELMGVSEFKNFAPEFSYYFLKFNHVIHFHILL